jgi:hypothetical protein
MTGRRSHRFSLLHDDALVVRVDDELLPVVSRWLPLHARLIEHESPGATIDVATCAPDAARASRDERPFVVFGGVRALHDPNDVVALVPSSDARGWIDLGARRARLEAPRDRAGDERIASDLYSMLTLAAAFLLGRLGAALVHAGCVVDPEGRAWLLAGDTHAGKTTTCVSLVAAGWGFLADDQVVLRANGDGALDVQGWPRHAHLDEGWAESVVTGTRSAIDLRARFGDRWMSRAPLGGLLLPAVNADAPTAVTVVDAATSFTALVRQSPWLIADRGAASSVMALLRDAASRPAYSLSLGRDSYARGEVLAERLVPARAAADAHAAPASHASHAAAR